MFPSHIQQITKSIDGMITRIDKLNERLIPEYPLTPILLNKAKEFLTEALTTLPIGENEHE